MAYTPLNLQNGQVLTAEDLQHMEQGILANELPPSTNFQQLVTDGSGNVGWADRLAYEKEVIETIVENAVLTFSAAGFDGAIQSPFEIDIQAGTTYYVTWGPEEYECEVVSSPDGLYFGDPEFERYPFTFLSMGGVTYIMCNEAETVAVAVRAKYMGWKKLDIDSLPEALGMEKRNVGVGFSCDLPNFPTSNVKDLDGAVSIMPSDGKSYLVEVDVTGSFSYSGTTYSAVTGAQTASVACEYVASMSGEYYALDPDFAIPILKDASGNTVFSLTQLHVYEDGTVRLRFAKESVNDNVSGDVTINIHVDIDNEQEAISSFDMWSSTNGDKQFTLSVNDYGGLLVDDANGSNVSTNGFGVYNTLFVNNTGRYLYYSDQTTKVTRSDLQKILINCGKIVVADMQSGALLFPVYVNMNEPVDYGIVGVMRIPSPGESSSDVKEYYTSEYVEQEG